MTTLDQAFIRAYQQQDGTPAPPPPDPTEHYVPLSNVLSTGNFSMTDDGPDAETSAQVADDRSQPSVDDHLQKQTSSDRLSYAPPAEEKCFRPLLQVDNFNWPPVCLELLESATEQMDQLVDTFVDSLTLNQRVFAVSGCQDGEGCSTLLLSIAKRMKDHGLKIAIVDSDLRAQGLAKRLGVRAVSGWEKVMLGQLPLQEVLIESINDRITILPLCGTEDWRSEITTDGKSLNSILRQLGESYDIVLVDLGVPDNVRQSSANPEQASGDGIDSAVIIKNIHMSSALDVEVVQNRLDFAGIRQLGIVENFAA